MEIYFHPDNENFVEDAQAYQLIWEQYGTRIINALETSAKMAFKEGMINAIIFEGIGHSRPLCFRASYPDDIKRSTLVHELAHRLVAGNGKRAENSLEAHKLINPILYDAWISLYGKEFADRMVAVESARGLIYKEAWDWMFLQRI
jgi:hypothetical protein